MATRTTLNVSLPVELGSFIAAKIASGRYASASEVAGLRLLEPSEALSITARRRKRRESQVDLLRHLADIGTRKYVRCHRAYEEPYMVQLVPTGIRGLDEILLGGIIHNNTVLVRESPAQARHCLAFNSSITVRSGSMSRHCRELRGQS